jgi:hypothetical protein
MNIEQTRSSIVISVIVFALVSARAAAVSTAVQHDGSPAAAAQACTVNITVAHPKDTSAIGGGRGFGCCHTLMQLPGLAFFYGA